MCIYIYTYTYDILSENIIVNTRPAGARSTAGVAAMYSFIYIYIYRERERYR